MEEEHKCGGGAASRAQAHEEDQREEQPNSIDECRDDFMRLLFNFYKFIQQRKKENVSEEGGRRV